MKKIIAATLCLASFATANESADRLVTHTELGYIQTQGNTQTELFNLDAKAKKPFDVHVFALSIEAQYGKEGSLETKNKFLSELTYDYEFTEHFALGYLLGFKQDKFSSYNNQFYTGPYAAYKIIKTKAHSLTSDAGLLFARDDMRTTPSAVDEYVAYRVKGVYNWAIYENLKFDQSLTYRGSFEKSDNYFVTSKSALTNKISDILSAGVSYKIDYVNMPGLKEYTDSTFTANLIIDY
ncbi:MAG: DUF481 domain-containing protein [Epsilonproteobacteria bacterium]|nr:DUF481 domain-containing protein [Campylobacterota bacterium]